MFSLRGKFPLVFVVGACFFSQIWSQSVSAAEPLSGSQWSLLAAEESAPKAERMLQFRDLGQKERKILLRGPISEGAYITGGVIGTLFGLGIGHAIQGRYGEIGWVFTVGELAMAGLYVAGLTECVLDSLEGAFGVRDRGCSTMGAVAVFGAVGLLAFRVWEIVDLWAAPPRHNRRYRWLKRRMGEDPYEERFSFYFLPVAQNGLGATAALQLRF